ncbi:MAG: hypothetical protein E4H24_04210 [Thermomicrobiales bacterium]|jgi:hypothetical protein|nr:MAG: hypothetical protein E4H24_04210 [Thermomicrobiales bacterium]
MTASKMNPAPETNEVAVHESTPTPSRPSMAMRAGILVGSAMLVAVGAFAAMGASPSPTTGADPTAPAGTSAPDADGDPGRLGPWRDGRAGPLGQLGLEGRAFRGGIGVGFREITISAINGSNVSLETADGWSRTISVTSSTEITKGGATITSSDLEVGDQVRFAQERADDGTYSVTRIVVVLPTMVGQISAIDGNTLTITTRGGTTSTVHVDGDTTYQVNGAAGALSDLAVDSFIVAQGTQRADGSLDATDVHSGRFGGRGGPHLEGKPGFLDNLPPDDGPAPSNPAG